MIENNKKTIMTRERWADILDFLLSQEASIRTRLASAVHPDMIRTDVYLINATRGKPEIRIEVMEPDGGEKLLLWTFNRPELYHPEMIRMEIEDITFNEMISVLVNQIDVA
jgi:hypothetical protein